jgi:hypothetical protein
MGGSTTTCTASGVNMSGLIAIEHAFHTTLMVTGAIIGWQLLRSIQEGRSTDNIPAPTPAASGSTLKAVPIPGALIEEPVARADSARRERAHLSVRVTRRRTRARTQKRW